MPRRAPLLTFCLFLGVLAYAYSEAVRDPVVVDVRIALIGLPPGSTTLRVALISDLHVSKPDMPPDQVAAIVEQINRLEPDLIVIAGDFVGDKLLHSAIPDKTALAPLASLRARLSTVAVLGNHDHAAGSGPILAALKAYGITVLENETARVGPVIVAGLGDRWAGREDLSAIHPRLRSSGGAPVLLLAHNPDIFPEVPSGIPLVLAGHTYGGQIVVPWFGPIVTAFKYGRRYAYGLVTERGHSLIVTGGLGTSTLPLRLARSPEIVLLSLISAPLRPRRPTRTP